MVALFNVVAPDIFNEDNNVDAPETYKLVKLVLLKMSVDVAFKLLINKIEKVDNEFKLLNVDVDVYLVLNMLIWNLNYQILLLR
jgi:hypothetical protein